MSFSVYATKATSHLLLPATIMLILGIWFGAQTTIITIPLFVALASVAFFCFAHKRFVHKIFYATFFISVFAFGVALYRLQQKKHTAVQEVICGAFCTIKGKINSLEKSKQPFLDSVLTVRLQEIKKNGQWWTRANGTIALHTKKIEDLRVADTIEIRNLFLKKPTEKSFDQFLTKNGIAATAFTPELKYTVTHRPWFSLARWVYDQKQRVCKNLKEKISGEIFSFFSSMFLGNRNIKQFSFEKAKTEFKNWGILHFLARSGLHLIIFILIWSFLLTFVPISFSTGQLILIFLSLLYYCMSWSSISFARALSVFLLYKATPLANRRTNATFALLAVCFFTLMYNPIALFFLDFQLSFGLAYALSLFGQLLRQKGPLLKKC